METNEYELIVAQHKNPLWKIFVAGIFFAFAINAFLSIVTMPYLPGLKPEVPEDFNKNIVIAIIGMAIGIYFSVRLTILIDTDKEKLVSRYFLGFFSINRTTEIPKLDHVAITKNPDDIYRINLWYNDTKKYTMCYSEEKEAALTFAKMVAAKLKIDLLDATEKGISKWIDKTNP
jgi:hypothetical protein